MKIRTKEEFFDRLDKETSWRKKELTNLLFSLREARPVYEAILIRSGVALSYAHWEGFVKTASEFFLIYLSSKRIKGESIGSDLRNSFLANKISSIGDLRKIDSVKEFMLFLEVDFEKNEIYFDPKKTLTTKSNLKCEVFSEIVSKLGISIHPYQTKFNIIDAMVTHRNSIAHGENVLLTKDHACDYINLTRGLIDTYTTDLTNVIVTESYLKTSKRAS